MSFTRKLVVLASVIGKKSELEIDRWMDELSVLNYVVYPNNVDPICIFPRRNF